MSNKRKKEKSLKFRGLKYEAVMLPKVFGEHSQPKIREVGGLTNKQRNELFDIFYKGVRGPSYQGSMTPTESNPVKGRGGRV